MNVYLARTLLLLISLCGTASAVGTRLDITLEGPWVLYEDDTTFGDNQHPVHVIIAMSPGGTVHHAPTFSTGGDAFEITPGIHCVAFDDQCLPPSAKSLSKDGYADLLHVPVHLKPGRKWYDGLDPKNPDPEDPGKDATYLILPMSDSYSNDGVDSMEFGMTFGSYGNPEQHSIGTEFHYDSGPGTVNLSLSCTVNSTVTPPITCPQPNHANALTNTGTLRITMRAPEMYEYCSFHVRDAYPKMLLLLDDTPLESGQNTNQTRAYIDLPDDSGVYRSCLFCDPQQTIPFPCEVVRMVQLPKVDLVDALNNIITQLNSVATQLKAPNVTSRDSADFLGIKTLEYEARSLDKQFPRFAQLRRIEKELSKSMDALKTLPNNLGNKAELGEGRVASYISQYLDSATSGKDCRSVQLSITP